MAMEIKKLCKRFGDNIVLKDFSAEFETKGITAFYGKSGCGKSTLLNIILGLTKPDSGTITGHEHLSKAAVFQEDRLLNWATALDNLLLVHDNKEAAGEMLEKLALPDSLNTKVKSLSGGMKRRVALARALFVNRQLLILDEPFNGLDSNIRLKAMDIIKDYSKNNCVILVTHDAAEIDYLADRRIEVPRINSHEPGEV